MLELALCVSGGSILGFLIGLTGVGGGVLTVPVLILALRLPPIAAVGTASLFTVFTKIYAGIKHYRQDTINVKAGLWFLLSALPGVVLSSFLVKWGKASLSPEGVTTLENALEYVIMASIALAMLTLLFDYTRVNTQFLYTPGGKLIKFLCLFTIGAIMGMTSIGGGILIIPALLLFYRETRRYVGTSIFIGLFSLAVMSAIYAFAGQEGGHGGDVNVRIAALMAVGSLVGTHQGSALSKKIEPRGLQFVVIGVIVLAVLMMILHKALK